MKRYSRVQNSLMNMISGFVYRILIMFTAFAVRTVFIRCLNEEYLGVNGLCSNILSMLSLAELGFGNAMVYSMYRPLAEKDYRKLQQLMGLYRKVYAIIGTVILIAGLGLIPFLGNLIKDAPDIKGLTFYYVLFLLDSVGSYWFFAYRNSLLQADQKAYVISNYTSVCNMIKSVFQILSLIEFHNFTIYLIIQIGCTIGQNVFLAIKVNREYPVFSRNTKNKLSPKETKKIFKDVKALMLSKISHVTLNSTDNIIISTFVGFKWVGIISNFYMITEAITGLLTQITGSLQASIGNYFAQENEKNGYKLFQRIEFLNYWLYGFCMISLIVLLNPFITIWIGKQFTLRETTVVILSINFFIAGFMNTLWTFRSTLGLFTQGQYRPLIVSSLNIGLSIGLSYVWGITGVLAATAISRALVNLWYDPLVLHMDGFHKSVIPFYKGYIMRLMVLILITIGMIGLSKIIFINGVTWRKFFVMMCFVAIIPNIIFVTLFHKTEEFQYFQDLLTNRILKSICKNK